MADVLGELKIKEKELELELSKNPLFKQLEGIRSTISLFENGHAENGSQSESRLTEVPKQYSNDLNWREKILFVLNGLNIATPSEVVADLKKLGAKETDEFLAKRISVMLSYLKRKKIIGYRTVGKKAKYFIK